MSTGGRNAQASYRGIKKKKPLLGMIRDDGGVEALCSRVLLRGSLKGGSETGLGIVSIQRKEELLVDETEGVGGRLRKGRTSAENHT